LRRGEEESYSGNDNDLTNLTTTPLFSKDGLSNDKRSVRYPPPDNNEPPFNANNLINPDIRDILEFNEVKREVDTRIAAARAARATPALPNNTAVTNGIPSAL